jgi:hypothetical protein
MKQRIEMLCDGSMLRRDTGRVPIKPRWESKQKFNVIDKVVESWNSVCSEQQKPLPTITSFPNVMRSIGDGTGSPTTVAASLDEMEENLEGSDEDIDLDQVRPCLDVEDFSDPKTRFSNKRFELPSTELLDAIHAKTSNMFAESESRERGVKSMFGKFRGESLVTLGILVQEMLRGQINGSNTKKITDEQVEGLAPNLVDILGEDILKDPLPLWTKESYSFPIKRRKL